jgi:hypothetical protein
MTLQRTAIPLLLIAALALVGAIVLTLASHAVPDELWTAFFAALTAGAGVTVPAHIPRSDA